MNKFGKKLLLRVFVMIPVMAIILGCAAESTEVAQPGTCALSCTDPKVGSSKMIVEPLFPMSGVDYECGGDFSDTSVLLFPGPLQVKYKIYEKSPPLGGLGGDGGGDGGDGGGGGGGGAGLQAGEVEEIPRSGIGFEPVIFGSLAAEKTNSEHLNPDGTVTPYKYLGIVTPKAEWCSDTCGVISYEIWPVCIQGGDNNITAGVLVQAIKVSSFYEITVSVSSD